MNGDTVSDEDFYRLDGENYDLRAENERLRAENAALRVATDEAQSAWASTAAVIEMVQEQNAALVAALRAIMDTDSVAGETPFQVEQRFHAIAHRAWHGALASVKGEAS